MKPTHFTLLACAAMLALACAAHALTVIPPTFDELVDDAELVFIGKVVTARAEWRNRGENRAIVTFVEFETEEILKGHADKTITLQFLGGTIGDVALEVPGVPRFATSDRVILFVQKNGTQFCPLVGIFHGKFGLHKDEKTGRDIVFKHDGKPLRDVAEIGGGDGAEFVRGRAKVSIPADREPLSADDFKTKLRERLTKAAAKN